MSLYPRTYLGAILVCACVLRTNHLFQPLTDVFSWRQASTAMMAANFHHGNWNIFFPEVSWTGPGPGYQGRELQVMTYLVALLYRVAGQQEWIGRAVSVAFGTWGVFAFHALVRRVWDEERALAAALILAILPGAVFIDRSFLPDPVMLSLVITSLWLLVLHLQTGSRIALVLAALAAPLAFATKPPGLVAVAPMLYATVWLAKRPGASSRRVALVAGVVLVALGLTAAHMVWAWHLGHSYPPYHVAGSEKWLPKDGFAGWSDGDDLRRTWQHVRNWLWTLPLCALAVIGTLLPPPRQAVTLGEACGIAQPRWLFHCWLLGCGLLYATAAGWLNADVYNFHIFNPLAAAFAGHALVSLTRIGERRVGVPLARLVTGVLIFGSLAIGQLALGGLYQPEHARQSHQLGLALRRWSSPDDLVVTIANDVGDPVAIYYSGRRGWVFPPLGLAQHGSLGVMTEDPDSVRVFEDLRSKGADWFGIVRDPKDDSRRAGAFWERHRGFREHLDRACELVEESADYVVYRIPPSDTSPAVSAGP